MKTPISRIFPAGPAICFCLTVFFISPQPLQAAVLNPVRELTPDVPVGGDAFGSAIAVNDSFVAVGVLMHAAPGTASGAIYLFDRETGTETRKITLASPVTGDRLGSSVIFNENVIYGGASGKDHLQFPTSKDLGAVYGFNAETGEELFVIQPPFGLIPNSRLGENLALANGMLFSGVTAQTRVLRFDLGDNSELTSLTTAESENLQFGLAIAAAGNRVLVGAPQSRAAYLFDATDRRNTGRSHSKTISQVCHRKTGF